MCPTKCPTKRYFWFTLHFVDIKNRNRNPPILDEGFLQRKVVVRPEGLEPSTNGLTAQSFHDDKQGVISGKLQVVETVSRY